MLQRNLEQFAKLPRMNKEHPMSSTKQLVGRFVRRSAAVVIVAGGAWVAADDHMPTPGCEAPAFVQCYTPTWVATYQREFTGCTWYAECPVTVLCGATSVYTSLQPAGPIVPALAFTCREYINGARNAAGLCVNGTPVIPSTVSCTANIQACMPDCIWTCWA